MLPCAPFACSITSSPAVAALEAPVPVVADVLVPELAVLAPVFVDALVPVLDVLALVVLDGMSYSELTGSGSSSATDVLNHLIDSHLLNIDK